MKVNRPKSNGAGEIISYSVLCFIESVYETTCCCCCVGCSPVGVTIYIRGTTGEDVMSIVLTGDIGKHPLDTAELRTASGITFATVKW